MNVSIPVEDAADFDLNWQQSSSVLPIFCYVLLTVAASRLVFSFPFFFLCTFV